MSNRRTGKIAAIPFDLRQQINMKIRDGITYPAIIEWLKPQGFDLNEQNFTNWVKGDGNGRSGYNDWLKTQERIDAIGARKDAALQMVQALKKDGAIHITEANELMLASQFNEVLTDFDPQVLKDLIADEPAKFFQLAMSINSQTSERTKRQKLELELEKFKDFAAEKLLDKALRAKADEINNSGMSNAAKIAAMRKAAFADVDELQASGAVQIPK